MHDDYERFSEKEVLEMIKSSCQKVWDTCVLLSLLNDGKIDKPAFLLKYPSFERNLSDNIYKFRRDRREWARKFKA